MRPEHLPQILTSGNIPHALLFTGPKGAGKRKAAYAFAASLLETEKSLENHPDVHAFFPEGKTGMHPLSAIRQLAHDSALAPYRGKWKIFILHEAEKMLPTSSNALLKTLEEPTSHTLILLLSEHAERLLPTVVSRCQTIEFPPTEGTSQVDSKTVELLCQLAENYAKETISHFESETPESVFETILFWYRDRLLIELGLSETLLHIPQHIDLIKKTPFVPLEEVEKGVLQARLGYERSTKLSVCLQYLFLFLRQV